MTVVMQANKVSLEINFQAIVDVHSISFIPTLHHLVMHPPIYFLYLCMKIFLLVTPFSLQLDKILSCNGY